MQQFLVYTIIGLTTGAIYAVAASGLVVTYTTSGIFNLAHGATGMISAFVYWQFRWGWHWPAPLALIITLGVLCPLFGAVVERVVMRGLQETSEVVRLSVTVSLFAALIGVTNWVWQDQGSKTAFQPFFGSQRTVEVFGFNLTWHKLITFGCAVLVAVGLRVLLYRTRLGIAMRAVVDDRNLSELTGSRPDRVASFAWALGSSLAGLAGLLLAGEVQLNVTPLALLVINAYAAAIVGRLRSLPLTFVGAIILGLLVDYYKGYSGSSWFPQSLFGLSMSGLGGALPTLMLFAVLVLLPQTRLRSAVVRVRDDSRVPSWSTAWLGAALLVGFVVMVSGMLSGPNTISLTNGLTFSIAALSLVPLTGYAGQVSLAPLTFAGLGAVAMAKLPGDGNVLSLIGAVAIVALIGAVVALPALRLSGVYLALATGAFAVFVSRLVFNQPQTFGAGNIDVPALQIPGVALDSPRAQLIAHGVAFAVLSLGVIALRRSRLGRRFVALKDSPIAAATLGMNLVATKVAAFAISAGIAAFAGALAGRKVGPDEYDFVYGLPVVLLAVVGGVGCVSGALFGGMLLGGNLAAGSLLPALRNLSKVTPGLIGISLGRNPNGAAQQTADRFRSLLGRWPLIGIGVGGVVAIWALTTTGTLSRWTFVAGIALWTLAVVPNLAALADQRGRRQTAGIVWLVVGLAVALLIEWSTLSTPGWRLIGIIALIAAVGPTTSRVLDTTPRVSATSPDNVGLDGAFPIELIERADRRLGVVL